MSEQVSRLWKLWRLATIVLGALVILLAIQNSRLRTELAKKQAQEQEVTRTIGGYLFGRTLRNKECIDLAAEWNGSTGPGGLAVSKVIHILGLEQVDAASQLANRIDKIQRGERHLNPIEFRLLRPPKKK